MTPRGSRRWILGVFIIILLGAIVFAPSYGWKVRNFLTPGYGGGIQANVGDASDTAALAAENDILKAQIATYQTIAAQLPQNPSHEIRALVYSRYPFDFKNELLVNVGGADGVTSGTAATFDGMLIGRVTRVFAHQAVIETVFDSGFEMPVRVGTSSYDGLFKGGSYPSVNSIAKSANLQAGDIIYTAAPGLPYGVPVGEVNATGTSADSLFTQATVTFPYDINDVQTILINQSQ